MTNEVDHGIDSRTLTLGEFHYPSIMDPALAWHHKVGREADVLRLPATTNVLGAGQQTSCNSPVAPLTPCSANVHVTEWN